jgi:hypothetical protein
MLDKQKLIGNQAAFPLFDKVALDGKRLRVPHLPQVPDMERSCGARTRGDALKH